MVIETTAGALLALATALPLAWKWQLGVVRVAAALCAYAVILGLLLTLLLSGDGLSQPAGVAVVWLTTLGCGAATLAYRFYRDPERVVPDRDDVVLSPADGTVLYVRQSKDGMLPVSTKNGRQVALQELTKTPLKSQDAVVIGIGLNLLDVHVNRAPFAGRVTTQRHYAGSFGSLRRPEMVFENERATMVIERDELQVAVVLIASRLVRQIALFVKEDESVSLGQRIGVIRFGSQVDLVLPADRGLKVGVSAGQRVTAGQTIVALLEAGSPRSGAD